jgi:2-polyprenyl-3-methyl-5-hydroxy-6-metoxy-1,4-benzoquinol methylase
MNILDVGCSNGALGGYLKAIRPTRVVTGIEFDTENAQQASSTLDCVVHANIEAINLLEVLASQAPFDCVVCADVLEHLREPWVHLVALRRLLKPNGCVILSLPNIRHHSALLQIWLHGSFPRRPRGIFDATHLRWFTYFDAVELARSADLIIETSKHAIRIGDRGGGVVNRIGGKLLSPLSDWWLIREFFVYQFTARLRAS